VDDVEKGAEAVDVVQLAGQRRRQIEPEAVDPHFGHPVAQRIHQQLEHRRVQGGERVAGAGVVHIEARRLCHQPVVAGVVDAAEGEGRAEVVALGGVVVDDVEDHLEAGGVERLDHRLELAGGPARRSVRGVARLGREKVDRVVAPVVGQPLVEQVLVVEEGVDRQELDGGDAELLQVRDHPRRGEAGVGAAELRLHLGVAGGEAFHVQLVDERIVEGDAGRPVGAPVEGAVDDDSLRHAPGVVELVDREVGPGVAKRVGEDRRVPIDHPVECLGVGVDQQLHRVEAVAPLRLPWTRDAEAVALARTDAGQIRVPDERRLLPQRDPLLIPARLVEQAELDRRRVLAEEREIRPLAVPRRAKRRTAPRQDPSPRRHHYPDHPRSLAARLRASAAVSARSRPIRHDRVALPPTHTSQGTA
jgi:hypothetical protein